MDLAGTANRNCLMLRAGRLRRCAVRLAHSHAGDGRPDLSFSDAVASFQDKSTAELVRAAAVFHVCSIRPIVLNSHEIVKKCDEVLSPTFTDWILRVCW